MTYTTINKIFPAIAATAGMAAALLSSPAAHAQSSVRIYGTADVYVGSMKTSGSSRETQINSGGMTTSYLGFGGQEDLGNDLKALFALEGYMRLDSGEDGRYTGDKRFARAAYVGLSHSSLGTLQFGRIGTPLFTNTLIFNPLGGSFGFSPAIRNIFSPGNLSGDSGWDNAVAYSSPKIGGFSGTLIATTKESSSGSGNGSNVGGSLSFRQGAFAIGLAAQQVKTDFSSGSENTWQLGASYDFGPVKLYGMYTSIDEGNTGSTNTGTRDKISQIGVSVPVGPGAILASWSRDKVSGNKDYRRDVGTVGYDYTLSKRTDIYAMLMADKISTEDRGISYALGMRHAF